MCYWWQNHNFNSSWIEISGKYVQSQVKITLKKKLLKFTWKCLWSWVAGVGGNLNEWQLQGKKPPQLLLYSWSPWRPIHLCHNLDSFMHRRQSKGSYESRKNCNLSMMAKLKKSTNQFVGRKISMVFTKSFILITICRQNLPSYFYEYTFWLYIYDYLIHFKH